MCFAGDEEGSKNMSKKLVSLILAVMLLIVFGMSSAMAAVVTNTTNKSGTISFKGKVKAYKVTYNVNGGSGKAPTDANRYSGSDPVTVLGQGEMVAPAGKTFAGWAAVSDAKTAAYKPGSTITIGGNLDLYAVWLTATSITATYHYKDKNDKEYVKAETYASGETVTMPSLSSLGWTLDEGYKFDGWYTQGYGTGTQIAAGASNTLTESQNYYATASTTGRTEFVATITWDDAGNFDEVRPYPDDVIRALALDPAANSASYITATNTSGKEWTIVWSNLDNTGYKIVAPSVEGYTVTASSGSAITFHRTVAEVSMTMWITNKKWDKYGDLIKFKAGQTVKFRMDITNEGNQSVSKVLVYETLKGAKFVKADGYRVTSDGYASIGNLGPHQTVSVWATYRITNSDTRKDKVANVAGVDYMRNDGSWGDDWDAVRIPINKKSSTATAVPTPLPTPTPIPVTEYMVERLVKDAAGLNLSYPNGTIDVVGADEILTPEEFAVYQTLNTQDKILTVLNSIGFDALIPVERLRLNLSVSETALNLMNTIYARKQVMTAEEKAAQQAKEAIYFPKQSVINNGYMQNYFEMALKLTVNNKPRIDRYTFREETNGQWSYVRTVIEQ